MQDREVHLGVTVQLDQWANLVQLETRVHQDRKGYPELPDLRALKERGDPKVALDLQVSRDHPVCKDPQENQADLVSLVQAGNQADLEDPDHLEKEGTQESRDLPAPLVNQERLELLDPEDVTETGEHQVNQVQREISGQPEISVHLGHVDPQDPREEREN